MICLAWHGMAFASACLWQQHQHGCYIGPSLFQLLGIGAGTDDGGSTSRCGILGRARRLILVVLRQQRVSGSAAKVQKAQTKKGRLAPLAGLPQQPGAKAARPEQRECFEALAARQRSLFSAAMNAARGPDGVPDSPAPAAAPSPGMELAGALQSLRCRHHR